MPTPYDLYIRFLASGGFYEVDEVNEKLSQLNLPPVKYEVVEAQHTIVCQTLPGSVEVQASKRQFCGDFLQWMKVLEVDELWYFEKEFRGKNPELQSAVKLAYDLNQDRQLRLAIAALLIKGMPTDDIVQCINARYSCMLKAPTVLIFEKYFFSPRRMTRAAWKSFLKGVDSAEQKVYFTALTEPLEVVKTELELPAKVSASETLQWLLMQSYRKAKQYMGVNTPEGNKEARQWIDSVLQLVDKYEKYRSTDASDFSNALQLEFEFVDSEFDVPDQDTLTDIAAKIKKQTEEQEVKTK